MKTYTIITGASKGIGKAFAFECAAKKMNLILVARSAELLHKLADELSATGVEVKTIAIDLLEAKAADKIFDRIKSEQWNVNMLINNAGIGDHGAFAKQSLQHQLNTMQLNMNVMVEMAYHFLHNSDKTQKRYILEYSQHRGVSAGTELQYLHSYKSVYFIVHRIVAFRNEATTGACNSTLSGWNRNRIFLGFRKYAKSGKEKPSLYDARQRCGTCRVWKAY
jgi:NADP-dependent 3-hydroxy acid dehydrogenase YdfG